MELKIYQRRTLDTLRKFFDDARVGDPAGAFAKARADDDAPPPYKPIDGLPDVPYVCLRIPTGGGKTVLGAHIAKIAAETWLERERPLVLWLVPTTAIRTQTLEAFKNPRHPYRRELDDAFAGRVRVFDIGEIEQIRPADLREHACVVIATFATARVNDTTLRDFYAHKEMLEPHFLGLDPAARATLEKTDKGEVAFSFANLLRLHRPLVITDEAHNANTKLSFEVYQRLSPSAVIELTATPDHAHSNVLVRVSASELKAEEMIKLPVLLTEHPGGDWREAVRDALLRRRQLAEAAAGEREFVRPILLIQAENDNQTATVAAVKAHLIDNEHLDEAQIAIATGEQRELDGIDLFARDCRIEVVITKQALKEGWDCSFVYVFCSVAKVRSGRDAEQLLGRVLRMPYARRRAHEDLNRAYAHVLSHAFGEAAEELTGQLADMGFEGDEAASNVEIAPPLFPGHGAEPMPPPTLWLTVETANAPDLSAVPEPERAAIQVQPTEAGTFRVSVSGEVGESVQTALVAAAGKKAEREKVQRAIAHHQVRLAAQLTPAQRFARFEVPRLCWREQGQLFPVAPELILDLHGWDLLDYPADLSALRYDENTQTFLLDLDGEQLQVRHVREDRPAYLEGLSAEWTPNELVLWLDRRLRQADVPQPMLMAWLRRAIDGMLDGGRFTLAQLVRAKFVLARKLADEIKRAREAAQTANYQQTLFANDAPVEVDFEHSYRFDPMAYPVAAGHTYSGSWRFKKHYYALIGDLRQRRKDGSLAAEFTCAQQLDVLDEVEFWVRNLVHPTAFWLPLARGRTYPDFVAKLTDGRLLVVEYKGGDRVSNDDSKDKKAIGELWERRSNGRGLYLMATERDDKGRDVRGQLLAKIRGG